MAKSRCLIIIPAFNEQDSISNVVENIIQSYPDYDYVVVNDGSVDHTGKICRANGNNLLDLPINLGLAGAFHTGLKYAYENDYEYCLQYDADGQHQAKYIDSMIEQMDKGYDIVIGSRFLDRKIRFTPQNIGNKFISLAMRIVCHKKITDSTSGMRMWNRKMMRLFVHDLNCTPEPDTVAYLIKNGAKVCEVPVKMKARLAGRSYLTAWKSVYYMLRVTASIFIIQWFRPKLDMEEGLPK